MKLLKRNLQTVSYRLCEGEKDVVDSEGYETGEKEVSYSEVKTMKANVSEATGSVSHEQFGLLTDYDKVLVTDDTTLGVKEDTVFYLDGIDPQTEKYNYVVTKVSKSLNVLSIALKKVV